MKKLIIGSLGFLTALTLTFSSSTSQEAPKATEIISFTHGHTG